MKKNTLSKLLAVGLAAVLTLTACSGGSPAGGSSKSGGPQSGGTAQLAQGVSEKEILVGHLAPQSGVSAVYDLIRQGIQAYFNYTNEQGGVHGRKLKLIAYDDGYQPAKTVQLVKRLVEEDKVFALLGSACTPCNAAAQPYLTEKGTPVIMVSTGAKRFVDPPVKNYFGSSFLNYRVETKVFMDYTVNKLGKKRIAIVYQNDDFGKENLEASHEAVKNYPGVEILGEIPFVVSDPDMSSQAQKIKQLNPEAIIMFGPPNPVANFKKELHKYGIKDTPFIVSSIGANDLNLFKLAGSDVWAGTISSAVIPMPDAVDDPGMKLYVERFSKDFPGSSYHGFAQWGWSAAQVMVEGLKRTGPDITYDKFFDAMHTFDNWKGSMYSGVTFAPDNHYGLTSMFITQAVDGKIIPISKTINFNPKTNEITYEK
ncbi:ABC transporter substrate-binding protein [Paenibacillus validus]|uniref:ABC transporter substrate-binding protein n=1 Tax=Paenibacillus validus TaxID=44253 RepID=A0A7X3CSK0_9BACL|nr:MULTISPECIES: ABC transporter substrate-binding protein [Paenibacillus]MED4601899.1 ABC transporter substrate-binding protein [Paenibacillus validus]MED4606419.1 ABC transporter substrate-binding protein [Paenibacillus validus]MUG70059.1 ABC transporter substrate-binding protein [Paenibacillus validus]